MITIDQILAEKIMSWHIGEWPMGNLMCCLIALILTILLAGLVGLERERRGRTAGLRTHLLVGVGSCVVMIVSIYGFPAIFGSRDVARLAAQVITGIGFLGAGAIIHRNSGTKGLTSAATIWIVMAIGLACGSFNFILATISTLLIIVVLTVFRKIETKLAIKTPLIILEVKKDFPVIAQILTISTTFDCSVRELNSELLDDGSVQITFYAVSRTNEFAVNDYIATIEKIEGISKVGILNNH